MDLIGEHLAHLHRRNLRPSTITQRRYALMRFHRASGIEPIAAGGDDLRGFFDRPVAPQTRAAEMSHFRGFYVWAIREGYRADNPMDRIDRPKLPRGLPRPIPEADLAMALDLAPPDRIGPWLHLAAYAGLRACECATLRADDLWWHLDPPILLVRDGKGGDDGSVPIAPVLELVLRDLPRRGWLFPRKDGQGGPVPPHIVSHMTNRYLRDLGISHTFHSLRHRFCTQVYRASGRDLRQTQELARHRSPVSTAVYTFVDPGEAASVVAALPT